MSFEPFDIKFPTSLDCSDSLEADLFISLVKYKTCRNAIILYRKYYKGKYIHEPLYTPILFITLMTSSFIISATLPIKLMYNLNM